MKVKVGSDAYFVKWYRLAKEPDTTVCSIWRYIHGDEKLWICTANCTRHKFDQPNLVIARKVSFTRAVSVFGKDIRRVFWDKYKLTMRLP